jgi:hypothetical protein
MTPLCPVCKEPMKEQGRSFRCEPCRQFIVFFDVPDASIYIAHQPACAIDECDPDVMSIYVPRVAESGRADNDDL